jgi:U3 small nucleolar RNA-associated protein 23
LFTVTVSEHSPVLTRHAKQVRRGNPDHWFIATQDKALQAQVACRTGVPLVFASVNGLHLADPPEQAKAAIAATQAADQVLPAHERTTGALKDLEELKPKDESWKKFKRKKTKGPNPLSVKKKQKKGPQPQHRPKGPDGSAAAAAAAGGGGDGASSEAAAAAKKRKRKKAKQPKQQPAADGGAAGGE